MITKRTFLAAGAALLASGSCAPLLAQGGDDPMPGIDIIIKKDPWPEPKPFSFSEEQMEAVNAVKGDARPTLAMKLVAEELMRQGFKLDRPDAFVAAGAKALSDQWCGPCKMLDAATAEFKQGETAWAITFKFHK